MLTSIRDTTATCGDNVRWYELALCSQADPDLWFLEPWEDEAPAKRICGRCPVRTACLAYALDADEEYGVWGGLAPEERRELKRQARVIAPATTSTVDGEAA